MEPSGWAGIVSIISVVLVVGREIVKAINHRRIRLRSPCCDKEAVASVDIEATTPPDQRKDDKPQLEIKTPAGST